MLLEVDKSVDKVLVYFRSYELEILSILNTLASLKAPTGRQTGQALVAAQQALGGLLDTSQTRVAPILRLGYVRAARQTAPKYSLTATDQLKLQTLEKHTLRNLSLGAQYGVNRVIKVSRRALVASQAQVSVAGGEDYLVPLTTIPQTLLAAWGLEQHAHAVLRNATERAFQLGTLAP